jgi:ribosomal protein S18 acetylase RimI-like enzyme
MSVQRQIRSLRRGDIPRCGQIYVDAYQGAPYHGCWDLPTATRLITEVFRREGSLCWVIENNGQVAGFILCSSLAGTRAVVEEFAVDAQWQGQGLGSQLLDHALTEFRRRGYALVELIAHQQAPAWKLYQSRGFAESEVYRLMGLNLTR